MQAATLPPKRRKKSAQPSAIEAEPKIIFLKILHFKKDTFLNRSHKVALSVGAFPPPKTIKIRVLSLDLWRRS